MSLRAILLILALVPSAILIALWAVSSSRLYNDWKSVNDQNNAGNHLGAPVDNVAYQLQTERRLSAAALADPEANGSRLVTQRGLTDRAAEGLDALADDMPAALVEHFKQLSRALEQLPSYRDAVDRREATQQQTFDDYTGLIASDIQLLEDLLDMRPSAIMALAKPTMDAQWGQEMLSQEDAVFTAGMVSGHLTAAQRAQLAKSVGSQQYIFGEKVVPRLAGEPAKAYQDVQSSAAWRQKDRAEQAALTARLGQDGGAAISTQLGKDWKQSYGAVEQQLMRTGDADKEYLVDTINGEIGSLMRQLIVNSVLGAVAVLVVFLTSLRLTGVLRRRIFALRTMALDLQTRLPDVVERVRQGETIDVDAELPEVRYGNDELGMLGRALNQARNSAVETALREVEQHRGFERLLQRVARRTQLLIGMQMKRLGEMQRKHEDPEILEGLFAIDHLAVRLRRYEENLVILGGGQTQRRWRKPVLLVNVLRSAQGEVQDYRRIRIEGAGDIWVSGRAVGPMVHIFAELIENAVSFSRPPAPVQVLVSRVSRGVAVEIEDRGLGMDPEQYAAANRLMASPPQMDVMSRSDDARLGLYVVARLSDNLGLQVDLRPSSFGGTRVVVLVPQDLIADGNALAEAPNGSVPDQIAPRDAPRPAWDEIPRSFIPELQQKPDGGGRHVSTLSLIGPWTQASESDPVASASNPTPLPRRVRQASLAAELRNSPPAYAAVPGKEAPQPQPLPRRTAQRRSGATISAFQRQSRIARFGSGSDQQSTHLSPDHDRTREEER
ncbi:nitrate- and nitrite sensing domain-containing protein [Streptomyces sp. NPDC127079]|uniref:sensor histidine kinase n=1 Tax=Streptomyces sp. NPDC127079 TaxID=3347132 RepID=UPI0036647592